MTAPVKMAWHYTIGDRAEKIFADGIINPASTNVPAGERPVVWFSLRQHWEPTANKGWQGPDGKIIALSFEQTIEQGGGGWRFGLPAADLVPWRELQSTARITRDMARALERAGRKAGSDPALWLASLEPVKIERCVIEHLHGDHWHAPHHDDQQ